MLRKQALRRPRAEVRFDFKIGYALRPHNV